MLFSNITILDDRFVCRTGQYVGIKGAFIDHIGPEEPAADYGERVDGRNRLMLPGLVNAHSHAAMTLLRGYGEGLALDPWLKTRVFPFESRLRPEDIYNGALLAFAEMLRCGVVSVSDMYFEGAQTGRAALESGIKCNLCLSVSCFDDRGLAELPVHAENQTLLQELHGAADGRLRLDLCLHSEYTTTPKVARQMAEYARETGLRMQVHLSETRKEHEECKARRGVTPARYFARNGLFDAPTTAAHCVWLEDDDIELLRERGVTAVNCPVSNLKLSSGFCDVPKLLRRGVNVALGTDGAASNNSLDLMEEMKLLATLSKGTTGDPAAVSPAEALRAATLGGALAQGRGGCGALRAGNRADLILLDLNAPSMHPVHDMLNNVVYAARGGDVCLTMVDGRVLYRDGAYLTVDIERALFQADRSAKSIAKQL